MLQFLYVAVRDAGYDVVCVVMCVAVCVVVCVKTFVAARVAVFVAMFRDSSSYNLQKSVLCCFHIVNIA